MSDTTIPCEICRARCRSGSVCSNCEQKYGFCQYASCNQKGKRFDKSKMRRYLIFYFCSEECLNQFEGENK